MVDVSKIAMFFEKLDALENRHRIRFKRSCGMLLKETDTETMQVFYRILPVNVYYGDEDLWFVAACIHCLWPAEEKGRRPMQECIACVKDSSDSFEKRFTGLLETLWGEDGYLCGKLERMAKYLKQKGYAVDGAELLPALIGWNDEEKRVQKRWIKAYWRTEQITEEA